MKKFIIRGSCFVAIAFLVIFISNLFYVKTNGYKSLDGTQKFFTVPGDLDVINLGSSHGEFGFDYSEIEEVKGYNLGLRGQGHYFDFQILKKYSDRLAPGCVVIMPVSYYSLLHGVDAEQRAHYYGVLDYGSIPGHDAAEYIRFSMFPILSASFNVKYLVKDKPVVDCDLFPGQGPDEDFYTANGLFYYDLFCQLKRGGATNEENLKTLGEMIEYCRAKGFRPVLATTPFTDYYNYWYTKEDRDEFYAAVGELIDRHDVTYMDYSRDPRFARALELYADSDHLNPEGRRVFTEIILGDLGIIRDGQEGRGGS